MATFPFVMLPRDSRTSLTACRDVKDRRHVTNFKTYTYSRPPRGDFGGDCSAQKSWLLGATSLYFLFCCSDI